MNASDIQVYFRYEHEVNSMTNLDHYGMFTLDMDGLVKFGDIDMEDADAKRAVRIIMSICSDGKAFGAGRRNHDAVDIMCALHALGVSDDDIVEWIDEFLDRTSDFKGHYGESYRNRRDCTLEHVNRILPYLEDWGPEGREKEAMNYTIS